MKYSNFPRLNEEVSRIGFGAFGLAGVFGAFDETEAIDAIHFCWDNGINFIDTARHYGESEAIIAKALRSWNGSKPFIASKAETVGPLLQWARPQPIEACFPPGHITREAEVSLKTLGVECLDLFQMHLYWPNWGVEGYWLEELSALRESGKVRSIGISLPDQRHDIALPLVMSGAIDSVQTVINIFDPIALDCLVPICQQKDVAVIARCVLDEGGLTGTLKHDTRFAEKDFRSKYFDLGPRSTYIEKVDALRKFIPEEAGSLARLALKFVLQHPGVTTAVSSMHIRAYAEDNIRTLEEAPLSEEAFDEILHHHRWIRNFYASKVL